MTDDDWITTREAAEVSGYNPTYLRWLVRDGRIKARQFGRTWMIDRPSLLAYMENAGQSGDGRRGPKRSA